MSQLGLRDIKVNDFALGSPQIDTGDTVDQAEFLFQLFGIVFHFGVTEAVTSDRQLKTEYVTEVIADIRSSGPRRQAALDVADLAAQLIPYLR